eukprot:gb/GECG01004411.1/.p1 GENE.gb/GECG01004411.1/~~gb/GECG01004411.1/.p1  ORF type:complete len:350 (+),score=6.01 gb/GECG01004411.1/:1-1050(+)
MINTLCLMSMQLLSVSCFLTCFVDQEKFSKWNDPRTGINPFIPLGYVKPRPGGYARYLLDVMLVIIRIPMLVMLIILFIPISALISVIPSFAVQRGLARALEAPLLRVMLQCMGFLRHTRKELKRNQVPFPPSKHSQQLSDSPSTGDVVLVNHSSFVDVMILSSVYSPQFLAFTMKGKAVHVSLLRMMWLAMSLPSEHLTGETEIEKALQSATGLWSGPIVMFPEVARSNNQALLTFPESLSDLSQVGTFNTFLLGLKYPHQYFSPTHPIGSVIMFLLNLTRQVYNTVVIVSVPSNYNPQTIDFDSSSRWSSTTRDYLAHMISVKSVNWTCYDFLQFQRLYDEVTASSR